MSKTLCLKYRDKILNGTMLCIDPSSGGTNRKGEQSNAGWAIFKKGRIWSSGILELDHGESKGVRLRAIGKCMMESFDEYDILAIEDINGYKAPQALIQSCGVYISSTTTDGLIEMNSRTWQAIANRLGGWVKSDEEDAKYIGWAAIAFALGYDQKDSEADREETLIKVRKLM